MMSGWNDAFLPCHPSSLSLFLCFLGRKWKRQSERLFICALFSLSLSLSSKSSSSINNGIFAERRDPSLSITRSSRIQLFFSIFSSRVINVQSYLLHLSVNLPISFCLPWFWYLPSDFVNWLIRIRFIIMIPSVNVLIVNYSTFLCFSPFLFWSINHVHCFSISGSLW